MNTTMNVAILAAILIIWLAASAYGQTTSFTYQGNLQNAGSPANGNYDLEFVLFNVSSGGSQLGSTISQNGIVVSNGDFSVTLDFGNQFSNGGNRFLEIHVAPPG